MKFSKMFIARFMTLRFGDQYTTDDYYEEWVARFATGSPKGYMDEISLTVFNLLLLKEKA